MGTRNLLADLIRPEVEERDMVRRTYTVDEAAGLLGISRSTAYECVRTGELPSLRFRRRIVIPAHALEQLIEAAGRSAPLDPTGTDGTAPFR